MTNATSPSTASSKSSGAGREHRPAHDPTPQQERAGQGTRWVSQLRKNQMALVGALIVVAYCLMALLAPVLAPYDPVEMDFLAILQPPDRTHLLGTDEFGRDVLSRLLYGARSTVAVAFGAVLLAIAVGVPIGVAAGFVGQRTDTVLMRSMDVLMAFPALLLALAVIAILGQSTINIVIAIGVVYIPQFARVARAAVLSVKHLEFVEAGRAVGLSAGTLVLRHIVPNIWGAVIVQGSISLSLAVLYESALTFLGMGTQPPMPSWGLMLSDGRRFMQLAPWTVVSPGVAIMGLVLGFNLLGDGLRDILDPRLRGAVGNQSFSSK